MASVVEELKSIGVDVKVKKYAVTAGSGENEAKDTCEQVTIPGYPALEAVINKDLKNKGYLRALGKARNVGKPASERKVRGRELEPI